MKKIIYILSIYLLSVCVVSCTFGDDTVSPGTGDEGEINFTVALPDEQIVDTRSESVQEGMIENLYVLTFDHNGLFLSRSEAVRRGNPGEYYVRLAPTDPESANKKRIVHFICNYDWKGFSDVKSVGKHENEIVSAMSVSGGKIAYWNRTVLNNGISSGIFSDPVILLRNVAKVTVKNNATSGPNGEYMNEAMFAPGDYFDHGSVAPFDRENFLFDEAGINESSQATLKEITQTDFRAASTDSYAGESVLCYERKNSTSHRPMYIIVKAKYGGSADYTYYKLDIVKNGQERLYDIQRNTHFILDIQKVTGPGRETLQEAVNGPPSNNLLYSVVLEKYPSISDGISSLYVETTEKILVHTSTDFTIGFSYVPDINTGQEDNSYVQLRIEQDSSAPVIDEGTVRIVRDANKGSYTASTVSVLPEHEIRTAKLIVTAVNPHTGITLRRVVNITFRKPFEFTDVSLNPARVPAVANSAVSLRVNVPDNIKDDFFPLRIYVTTKALSPNLEAGMDSKLTLDYQIPGKYRYCYLAMEPGPHTINFKTTSSATSETMILEGDLFKKVEISLSN